MGWQSKVHFVAKRGYYVCRVNGKQHYLGKVRSDAYKRFAALIADTPTGERPASIAGAIDAYVRACPDRWRRDCLMVWARFAGALPLVEADANALEDFRDHLSKTTYKPGKNTPPRRYAPQTVRTNVKLARQCLAWCVDQGWLDAVPAMPRLPRPMRHPRDVAPDVLAKALDGAPSIFRFILATGCRPGEARLLRWEYVDTQRGTCEIPAHKTATKTGKPRVIYLTPDAKTIIEEAPRRSDYVFVSRLGKPYTRCGMGAILRRRGVTPYALRHSFAQHALSQLPIEDVAALLGHADLAMVQVYAQVRRQRSIDAAASLPSILDGVTPAETKPAAKARKQSRRKSA